MNTTTDFQPCLTNKVQRIHKLFSKRFSTQDKSKKKGTLERPKLHNDQYRIIVCLRAIAD